MTNFFDFQIDKLVVYSDDFQTKEFLFNTSNSFYKEDVVNFIKQETQAGNPSVIYWNSAEYTLIPQSIFLSKHIPDYLKLNFGELEKDNDYHFDILYSHQAVIVYALPKWIKDLKDNYFPIIPLKHHAGQLLTRSRGQLQDFVSIVVYKDFFSIIILKNGKLQSCNSIEYQTEIDIIYFLLLHQQKLELSASTKLDLFTIEANFTNNQIQDSLTTFKEFENYQITWNDKNEFYKSILCV